MPVEIITPYNEVRRVGLGKEPGVYQHYAHAHRRRLTHDT